jgi:steroid delta-isomerase-like uncharacterized protein
MDAQAQTLLLLQRYYAAFNGGDRETFFDCLCEDVVHDLNQGGQEVGRAAFRTFMARMDRCYQERLTDIVLMVTADGTRAAAEFVVHGTYLATDEGLPPASGQTYELPAGAFLAVRDGKIARVTMYYNLPEWCRQVGAAA